YTSSAPSSVVTTIATWWIRPGGRCRRSGMRVSSSGHLPSDRDQLAVDAPRGAEPVRDLADRRVGLDRLDERRQQVVRAPRGVLEPSNGGLPRRGIALRPDPPDTGDLAALGLGVDALDRRGRDLLVAEPVDPDDDLLARVDRALLEVCRLLDRALLEAGLERAQRA